ncbi:MAG: Asp-tRNA(Asn)/Glu-tRNA(Gln) amidotransferase subunit GatA [Ruminococcaceae bacterium]|nr:Asp-tRNA(Asn)/Glu-tRNA(Gln) amidotransferase subunit GatA [Oscillospiraceae bacterium]
MTTLTMLRKKLDAKEISSVELTKEYLKKISENQSLGAFNTVCEDEALKMAEAADKKIAEGSISPLTGVPLAIKDNICTKDIKTTCSSKMLADYAPPYNATVMEKLNAQGIVTLGKTSMDEFAMGGSSQTSALAKPKNPFNTSCVPGGSSGGSAVAVAAGLCAAALGSDTGGSVRQPASFCGITGMKPTYGTVSRYGLIAFGSSLDQIGPMANSAEDCGIILNAIAGQDVHDGTSRRHNIDFNALLGQDIKGMKIGIPKEFYGDGIDEEVKNAVIKVADFYKSLGAELVEVSMPTLKYAVSAYYLLACAEASTNLSRYDGVKYGYRTDSPESYDELIKKSRAEGFGTEVKRRILLGTYALSSGYYDAYYKKALAVRQQFRLEHDLIFEKCDLMLTPSAPTVAYGIDSNIDDPVKMYLADVCTVTANIAGIPAISVPCGVNSENMPIGFSLSAKRFDDARIIQFADVYEKSFAHPTANI